jgi:hypothetical protein
LDSTAQAPTHVGSHFAKLAEVHAQHVLADLESESSELDGESPEYARLRFLIKHLTRFVCCVDFRVVCRIERYCTPRTL